MQRQRYARQAQVTEFLLEHLDKLGADASLLVEGLVLLPLGQAGIPADGTDVDHAVAEFDKGATLDGQVEVGDVVQDEVDELLVFLLAQPLYERRAGQRLAQSVRRKPVFREAKVKQRRDVDRGRA